MTREKCWSLIGGSHFPPIFSLSLLLVGITLWISCRLEVNLQPPPPVHFPARDHAVLPYFIFYTINKPGVRLPSGSVYAAIYFYHFRSRIRFFEPPQLYSYYIGRLSSLGFPFQLVYIICLLHRVRSQEGKESVYSSIE
jgi:hypothetical protein